MKELPIEWFIKLGEIAQEISDEMDKRLKTAKEYDPLMHSKLPRLIGYIQSSVERNTK